MDTTLRTLSENDRIVDIQTNWEHQILIDFLGHFFDPLTKTFAMMLQRFDMLEGISKEVVEISRGIPDLPERIKRTITYRIRRSFTKVRLVECLGVKLCTISHTITNNGKLYFRINDKGKLVLDYYRLDDEKSYCFQRVQYKGIQRLDKQPRTIFFSQFISVLTGRCLTMKRLTKVGLTATKDSGKDKSPVGALTRPDPRYFKCNRTSDDRTKWKIESLVRPGLYVAVNPEKSRVFLSNAKVQGVSYFEIMPKKE